MSSSLLSIGDELLLGEKPDTNAPWIAGRLVEAGYPPARWRTVGDDRAAIAGALRELAASCTVVVATGGLGPTDDDLSRFALGDVVDPGRDLVSDPAAVQHLESIFGARRATMPRSNLVQTLRPAAATFIANPHGTALGLAARFGACSIFLLPGPPREMQPMLLEHVLPALARRAGLLTRTIHCFGLGESSAAERLGELTRRDRRPQVGITVTGGVVTARIRAEAGSDSAAAAAAVEATAAEVERCWHPYVFGAGEQTMPDAIGALLAARGEQLVTAESCTGGWLGKMLVDIPGSSAWYRGGWITYTDDFKRDLLDVDPALLAAHGAVSEEVAAAMARGALSRGGAAHALAITGIAGPSGGSAGKPVGLVFIARAAAGVDDVEVRRFRFRGDRGAIRERSVMAALAMLRFALAGAPPAPLLWEARR